MSFLYITIFTMTYYISPSIIRLLKQTKKVKFSTTTNKEKKFWEENDSFQQEKKHKQQSIFEENIPQLHRESIARKSLAEAGQQRF